MAFSSSSDFNRLASETSIPPYMAFQCTASPRRSRAAARSDVWLQPRLHTQPSALAFEIRSTAGFQEGAGTHWIGS